MKLEDVFNTALELCDEIKCPACMAFCRKWILAGLEVYKALNDQEADKDKIAEASEIIEYVLAED